MDADTINSSSEHAGVDDSNVQSFLCNDKRDGINSKAVQGNIETRSSKKRTAIGILKDGSNDGVNEIVNNECGLTCPICRKTFPQEKAESYNKHVKYHEKRNRNKTGPSSVGNGSVNIICDAKAQIELDTDRGDANDIASEEARTQMQICSDRDEIGFTDSSQTIKHHSEEVVKANNVDSANLDLSTQQVSLKLHCEGCNHTYKCKKYYEKHLASNSCKRICEFCGKIFYRRQIGKYNMHIKSHKNQRDYKCETCGKSYFERNYLLRHQQAMHGGERNYICEICGSVYPFSSALWTHKQEKHCNKRYPCQYCPKVYLSRSGLVSHLNLVHGEGELKQLPCSTCGKIFHSPHYLKSHEASHGTKDFQCEQCPSAFKTIYQLNRHKLRHEKAYRCYCKQCDKGFYSPRRLREHEMTHSGEKPYQCQICDFRCSCPGNLTKHMKRHLKPIE